MKQAEKFDLILKLLFDKQNHSGDIVELLSSCGIDIDIDDAYKLGRGLEELGYVKVSFTKDNADVELKSKGIEYVEGKFSTSSTPLTIIGESSIPSTNPLSRDKLVDLQQYTGQISKQPVEVAHCNSRKGKDSLTLNASVDDCTKLQYIQKQPV